MHPYTNQIWTRAHILHVCMYSTLSCMSRSLLFNIVTVYLNNEARCVKLKSIFYFQVLKAFGHLQHKPKMIIPAKSTVLLKMHLI